MHDVALVPTCHPPPTSSSMQELPVQDPMPEQVCKPPTRTAPKLLQVRKVASPMAFARRDTALDLVDLELGDACEVLGAVPETLQPSGGALKGVCLKLLATFLAIRWKYAACNHLNPEVC